MLKNWDSCNITVSSANTLKMDPSCWIKSSIIWCIDMVLHTKKSIAFYQKMEGFL